MSSEYLDWHQVKENDTIIYSIDCDNAYDNGTYLAKVKKTHYRTGYRQGIQKKFLEIVIIDEKCIFGNYDIAHIDQDGWCLDFSRSDIQDFKLLRVNPVSLYEYAEHLI